MEIGRVALGVTAPSDNLREGKVQRRIEKRQRKESRKRQRERRGKRKRR